MKAPNTGVPEVTFEDVWDRRISVPLTSALPTIDDIEPGQPQVWVPLPPGSTSADRRPADLAGLQSKPWVQSVVAEGDVVTRVRLPQIQSLLLTGWPHRLDRRTIANLPELKELAAPDVQPAHLAGLQEMRWLAVGWEPTFLEALIPRGGPSLRPFGQLPNLERLWIRWSGEGQPVDPLVDFVNLRWLRLDGWANLRSLNRLHGLDRLELSEIDMMNLRAFNNLSSLRQLGLGGRLGSLDGIGALAALESLWLGGGAVRDLAPLAELPRLQTLRLSHPDPAVDLDSLRRIPGLRRFELLLGDIAPGRLRSIDFLADLKSLEEISLINVDIDDGRLDPLFELTSLRRVQLSGGSGVNIDELRRRRPELQLKVELGRGFSGAVSLGDVRYDSPSAGIDRWFIFQHLSELLRAPSNADAEERIREELARRDPELLYRLEFDTEAGGVGIYARSEEDIRSVAEMVQALIETEQTLGSGA